MGGLYHGPHNGAWAVMAGWIQHQIAKRAVEIVSGFDQIAVGAPQPVVAIDFQPPRVIDVGALGLVPDRSVQD